MKPRCLVVGAIEKRAVAATVASGGLVLAIAVIGGVVRTLPFLVAPAVPLAVAAPFVRGLLAVGLETALLFGPPLGWALACAQAIARGEARALFAIGASPWRLVRETARSALFFGAFAAAAAALWGTEAAAPGRMARAITEASRRSCEERRWREPTVAEVPFVGASWVCGPNSPPRLAGGLPSGAPGFFVADRIWLSDDLRSIELEGARLAFGRELGVRVGARKVAVRGLAPWARASNLRPGVRALLLASTGVGLALAGAWALLRRAAGLVSAGAEEGPIAPERRLARPRMLDARFGALVAGGAGPVAALAVLSALERTQASPASYLLVPAAGLAALLLGPAVWDALRAACKRFGARAWRSS